MSNQNNLSFILTILEAIEKNTIYSKSFADADALYVANDQLNFNACQYLLMVVGEESKRISPNFKDDYPKIEWHLIAGLRNRIAHDYRNLDPNITYHTIFNYLPKLKDVLIAMLNNDAFDKTLLVVLINDDYYRHLGYLKQKLK